MKDQKMKQHLSLIFLLIVPFMLSSQEYDDYVGAGHAAGVQVSSSDTQSEGIKTVNGSGYDLDIQGSSKFLAHATLGYTIEDIETLSEMSMEEWIDNQMNIQPEYLTVPTIEALFQLYYNCVEELGVGCNLVFNVNAAFFRFAWWDNTMNGQDLLRQRVAQSLSEILIISDKSELNGAPHGLANYYDILTRNSFGNYRDLLMDVTLNPSMGFYLSHFNNPKSQPDLNIRPDENYAREIMQLFSIGLYELNQDGTRKIDPQTGLWIPTYDNEEIKGLAKVFTGLSGSKWADEDDDTPVLFGRNFRRYSLLDPMKVYENWHEPGPKTIVGGYTISEGQSGMQDIEDAIDHLFNHENVGPFLAYRLIQRLVKSNPTPQYISRVAGVFNDNGSGERGDMGAMIKAILLDDEALDCYWNNDIQNGMLRSPLLRVTQMYKGLKAQTPNGIFWNAGQFYEEQAGQAILGAPTVFNYYKPDYVPDSEFAYENMVGPEFEILNSSTSSNYVNWMLLAIMNEFINERYNTNFPNLINEIDFIPFLPNNDIYEAKLKDPNMFDSDFSALEFVDYLDILLANGQLSQETRTRIVESMENSIFDSDSRAFYATFMVMINPEYVIMK